MITKVEKITQESLKEAKRLIEKGDVVAMPTETVYGLGASAFIDSAVKKVFEIKGRPNDNPLIAHVHPDYDLKKIVDYDPPYAKKLREAYLPGPLTMVYPSKNRVSSLVSCGLDTLAIRVPSHKGAQAFLREVDIPIVAPSANLSKHVSPTTAEHVLDDFSGKIPLILDGGTSEGGIESTVLDVTGDVPIILRPGLITKEMIEKVVGRCEVYAPVLKPGDRAKSPGMMYKHYAPKCKTFLFQTLSEAEECCLTQQENGLSVGLMAEESVVNACKIKDVLFYSLGEKETEMASRLYALLRKAEREVDVLVSVEPEKKDGIMVGVLNRLKKACTSVDIK